MQRGLVGLRGLYVKEDLETGKGDTEGWVWERSCRVARDCSGLAARVAGC